MKRCLILCLCIIFILCGCTKYEKHAVEASYPKLSNDSVNSFSINNPDADKIDYHSVKMISVSSTAIAECGYDAGNRVLLIRFRSNGSLYAYYDVDADTYKKLCNAESIGTYFTDYIRDIYKYEKLESGDAYEVKPLYKETTYENAKYVLNVGSGKFHKKDCRYAKADNIAYVDNSKAELENLGYHACKTCKP